MLIDTKMNPFASAAGAPKQKDSQPVGILNIETPQNVPMPHEPSMVESGIGMAKDKALDVAMEKGTEMAFTGKYYKHKDNGNYVCAACDYELFSSNTKYDSGTGWPSFYAALDKDRILEKRDNTLGMVRTEILCARCESHLGHLFPDGPRPSGLRYCVNSISLDFKKAE